MHNFDVLKKIPILDVWYRYIGIDLKKQGARLTARCPWHAGGNERTASLFLFLDLNRNSFKCFSCGVGGSTIDLVMTALGLDFKEACRTLASDFGIEWGRPLTCQERQEARAKAQEAARRRELEAAFKTWCDQTYLKLCVLYRCIDKAIYYNPAISESIPDLLHLEPIIEYWLDILQNGNDEQKFELFKNEAVKTWTMWDLI